MDCLTVSLILFSSVAANHLGLVAAVEGVIRHRLPILNCPKCLTFWATLTYGCLVCCDSIAALPSVLPAVLPRLLAQSFLAAYLAIWLELLMFTIDTLYNRLYDKINKYHQDDGDEADTESDSETADEATSAD